ncbi:hypothetical protein K437DRAFT_96270 [Tilletiaria anomala UBC 951]|uniref:C3H1-type domain-containing protein n=1 Tax=Tilletiaria anomala (strain ATCC 24038 / CBS 436.72 / UBC 951) TaxID=1037660 RepID=A0A066WRF0_TILAU|nr:uncharacterized protein K437DRAFT_96270 [Tilletiaria anomala UBC 951]KDN53240.1 hypothetical protein K437DRAFT_96270 [Tilletiaria anomala UBC 951]
MMRATSLIWIGPWWRWGTLKAPVRPGTSIICSARSTAWNAGVFACSDRLFPCFCENIPVHQQDASRLLGRPFSGARARLRYKCGCAGYESACFQHPIRFHRSMPFVETAIDTMRQSSSQVSNKSLHYHGQDSHGPKFQGLASTSDKAATSETSMQDFFDASG